jgi:hypothetical protein
MTYLCVAKPVHEALPQALGRNGRSGWIGQAPIPGAWQEPGVGPRDRPPGVVRVEK